MLGLTVSGNCCRCRNIKTRELSNEDVCQLKKSKDGKEMLRGCCVCSDGHDWKENPLLDCKGPGCNVVVHQDCYGIDGVPSGRCWFCRKCETQDCQSAKLNCELCPSKDGALKRTLDTSNVTWAHVVCALYIPGVRFGDDATKEPIILTMVPQDQFFKSCYICESQGQEVQSKLGACMNCHKPGCKRQFHVTCAQSMGLLCKDAGNNAKYYGYCELHSKKLENIANGEIPAFNPVQSLIGAPSESNLSDKLSSFQGGPSSARHPPSRASNGSKDKQRKKSKQKSGCQVFPQGWKRSDRSKTTERRIWKKRKVTERESPQTSSMEEEPPAQEIELVELSLLTCSHPDGHELQLPKPKSNTDRKQEKSEVFQKFPIHEIDDIKTTLDRKIRDYDELGYSITKMSIEWLEQHGAKVVLPASGLYGFHRHPQEAQAHNTVISRKESMESLSFEEISFKEVLPEASGQIETGTAATMSNPVHPESSSRESLFTFVKEKDSSTPNSAKLPDCA